MSWSSALLAFLVSHLVGDVLLQTEWQAVGKAGGLRSPRARRPLLTHVAVYTVAFVPALVWVAAHRGAGRAIAVAAVIGGAHLLVDDGRLVRFWLRAVKGTERPPAGLAIAVDQTFHVLCLLGAGVLAAT